jgi:hypothetical protein
VTLRLHWHALDRGNDLAENVANRGTKDRKDNDNDDGDQNENQSIFHETLASLLHLLEHGFHLLSLEMMNFRRDYYIHPQLKNQIAVCLRRPGQYYSFPQAPPLRKYNGIVPTEPQDLYPLDILSRVWFGILNGQALCSIYSDFSNTFFLDSPIFFWITRKRIYR